MLAGVPRLYTWMFAPFFSTLHCLACCFVGEFKCVSPLVWLFLLLGRSSVQVMNLDEYILCCIQEERKLSVRLIHSFERLRLTIVQKTGVL